MLTVDDHILRILVEAPEGLFASDVAERLNKELRPDSAYKSVDIANYVIGMSNRSAIAGRTVDAQAIDALNAEPLRLERRNVFYAAISCFRDRR